MICMYPAEARKRHEQEEPDIADAGDAQEAST